MITAKTIVCVPVFTKPYVNGNYQTFGHRNIQVHFKQRNRSVTLNLLGILGAEYSMLRSVVSQSSLFNKRRTTFEPSFLLSVSGTSDRTTQWKCTYHTCPTRECKQLCPRCCQRDSRLLCSKQQLTQAICLRIHTTVLNAAE